MEDKKKEIFIEKARRIHGDKYDYSKVDYINNKTKVCIICPIHGEFWQKPFDHIVRKYGCQKCGYKTNADKRKFTKEDFIKKAKEKWGDEFDYSEVEYINYSTKVCIKDKNGKKYWQTPANHIYGFDCRVNSLKNINEFKERSIEIYGNKYDYSKVEYIDNRTKVCIICPKHGEFWQTPYSHVCSKKGCPKCAIEHSANLRKKSIDDFIKKANEIHKGKYDYSKVKYNNSHENICIICPKHGEFWQNQQMHLKGHGCPSCGGNKRLTTDEFIKRSINVHDTLYDYSICKYVNQKTKVNIICKEHGIFKQLPGNHLKGYGCPICNKNKHVSEKRLYDKLCEDFQNIKIIHSYHNSEIFKKQEIDIFFKDYKIAIEFQGEQHFKPIDFGGYGEEYAKKIFEDNRKRDIRKKEICKNNNIYLFYFSNTNNDSFLGEKIYKDYDDLKNVIEKIIQEK